jgi:hypothetical protein
VKYKSHRCCTLGKPALPLNTFGDAMNPQPTTEAPGAKASRTCGILSILFDLTCVGIPVGIVLGIVALVKHAKAKGLWRDFPADFRQPTATGMVLGIIGLVLWLFMLPFVGIVSAIAVPALLNQQGRARDKAAIANLNARMSELVLEYDDGRAKGQDWVGIHGALEKRLGQATERNPWNMQTPAFRYSIPVVSTESEEQALSLVESQATVEGEVVFQVSFPVDAQHPGFVAGAVRLKNPQSGSHVYSRAMELQ